MIKQIILGKTYVFRGRFVTPIERKRNVWAPDLVVLKLSNGDQETVRAREFRDHAETADKYKNQRKKDLFVAYNRNGVKISVSIPEE